MFSTCRPYGHLRVMAYVVAPYIYIHGMYSYGLYSCGLCTIIACITMAYIVTTCIVMVYVLELPSLGGSNTNAIVMVHTVMAFI